MSHPNRFTQFFSSYRIDRSYRQSKTPVRYPRTRDVQKTNKIYNSALFSILCLLLNFCEMPQIHHKKQSVVVTTDTIPEVNSVVTHRPVNHRTSACGRILNLCCILSIELLDSQSSCSIILLIILMVSGLRIIPCLSDSLRSFKDFRTSFKIRILDTVN